MSMIHAEEQQNEFFNDDVNDDTLDNGDGNGGDDQSPYIIRIRGLPWNTTKQEICDFFQGVNIVNGENGIHLVTLATNNSKPLGEAYIELASNDDLQLAHEFHKKNLGTRYIEVFEAAYDEFQSIMSKQRGAQDETVVRLRGLPWDATEENIADFFQGLQIKQNSGIHIPVNRNGKASGEAYVQFETTEDLNQALKRNMEKLGHRYIEIFRSTEQLMVKSVMQSNSNRSFGGGGGRNSNNGNFQSNGNNRMHPYDRNGGNNSGRGNNMRGRNQNMRNDFRRDRRSDGDMFMQNSGPPNNRNFGDRSFNAKDGFSNDRFDQNNQTSNFYDDFDLNEFAKNINTLDRLVNTSRNFNSRQNFPGNSGNSGNSSNSGHSGNDNNFGSPNWMRNQNNFNNSRGGNMNSFGGGSNNRFNNDDRNVSNQDDGRSGQHCIHMRGLPFYTDEMDVFNFFAPLKPSFCKIMMNKNGMHSGEAKAYFDTYEQVRTAMNKDRMKIGTRYIELFYGGSN